MRREAKKIGLAIVGAGRVGAVLAAALRSAGHEITAAAGDSDASLARIGALLPGVANLKPSAVARSCDVLLLTVPDDMLGNVVRVLADSGALREGQIVVHTSGRHGLAVLAPAARAVLADHELPRHPRSGRSTVSLEPLTILITLPSYGTSSQPRALLKLFFFRFICAVNRPTRKLRAFEASTNSLSYNKRSWRTCHSRGRLSMNYLARYLISPAKRSLT